MSHKDSLSWNNTTFQEALDTLSNAKSYEELDEVDEQEISTAFKHALIDYKRLFNRCAKEGNELDNETQSYQEEYLSSSSSSKRIQVIAELQEEIQQMISLCENPPKDILRKYSDDLVSRIENGFMDGFEVFDE